MTGVSARGNAGSEPNPPGGTGMLVTTIAMGLVLALLSSQALIGGTRLLFALPAYAIIAILGVLALLAIRRIGSLPDQICLASALLFFGYVLVRASFSPVGYLARSDIYSILAGLVVYFLTVTVLTNSKTRLLIVVCLLVAALGHVMVGAIQFRNGNNWMPISFLQRFDYGRRASGFYICPNHLAGLLEVLGIFGLSITLWSRWPIWAKLLIGYATAMCYVGVILTGSRGGYLSVLMSLFVFATLSLRLTRAVGSALQVRIGVAALVMAILGAFAIFLVIQRSDYLVDRTKTVVDNKNIRLDFWRAALDEWKSSPVIGTGSRTYLFYGRKFRTDAMQMDPVYTHNDYLQLLAEYGALGLATFLPFLLVHIRRGLISARRLGPRRIAVTQRVRSNAMALNLGALGAVAAYVIHSFFDFNLHIPANVLLMAFVFGILANSGVDPGSPPERRGLALRVGIPLMTAFAIILGVQAWRLAPGGFYEEQARAALRDHRPTAGLAFSLRGLQFERNNPQLYYYLGRSRVLAGEMQAAESARQSFYRAALPAYESARGLAPEDETYWLELAFTYDSLNRFDEAEWMFHEAGRLDPRFRAIRQYYQAHLDRWKGQGASTEKADPTTPDPKNGGAAWKT
jgi:O-antigen ligase